MTPKRKRYSDDFRANTVLMLEAAGYPGTKGALTAVANKVKAPPRTISRWFNKEQNPPPDRLVSEKRGELVERLEDMAHMLLDAMGVDIGENGVDAVKAAVAMGIAIDKWQLLRGAPTERSDQRILIERTGLSTVPEHLTRRTIGSGEQPETVQRPGVRA